MLRGIDPHHHLHNSNPLEVAVTTRAARRANELRQRELDYLARTVANDIARAFSG